MSRSWTSRAPACSSRLGERDRAGLAVESLDARGQVVTRGRSGNDSTLLFEGLTPGKYRVRLDTEQANRMKMSLLEPVEVVMQPGGGYAGTIDARVMITR